MSYNNLGLVLTNKGEHEEAIRVLREATALRRNDPTLHENLRYALKAKGDIDGELEELRNVLRLQPHDPVSHNDLGVALTKAGDLKDAVSAFERAIALRQGEYPEALNNLGLVLMQLGQEPEAFSAMTVACQQRPTDLTHRKNLSNVIRERNDLSELSSSMAEADHLRRLHQEERQSTALARLKETQAENERTSYGYNRPSYGYGGAAPEFGYGGAAPEYGYGRGHPAAYGYGHAPQYSPAPSPHGYAAPAAHGYPPAPYAHRAPESASLSFHPPLYRNTLLQ
eukprot:TRINITY_DN3019_c0_g1_i1.p1 TRINITY_DN3019_c0_g1~~TRINITY_DN3019_c0_g1_i1.p1  ORF type:complete len:283 (-),score=74.58 TRINITY_DN3019_c0_g1_i1:97-945(-)